MSFPLDMTVGRAVRRHEFWPVSLSAFGNRFDLPQILSSVAALTVAAQFLLTASPAQADCNRQHVVVLGTLEERENVCRALSEVQRYFAQRGITLEFELTIRFQSRIEVTTNNQFMHTVEHWPVSGYYRATTKELYMTQAKAPWTAERTPWHLPWNGEVEFSILEHEIIHAAIAQIMGENYRKLPHPWHEVLAYAIEISLMKPDLRAKVLANFPNVQAFGSNLEINSMIYGLDPDAFAIAAYKTYLKNSEFEWVKRVINFKFEMIDPEGFWPP